MLLVCSCMGQRSLTWHALWNKTPVRAKTDRYRAEFYKHYTGRDWTDARNYDLCLNSSKLGFEKCVEEIKAYIRVRF